MGLVLVDDLPWVRPFQRRCRARREPRTGLGKHQFFGRCDLSRNHVGDHALERGFCIMRWSTNWTAYDS